MFSFYFMLFMSVLLLTVVQDMNCYCQHVIPNMWAKQKPHKNAEPTQKHKTLMTYCQHFSIFSSGCKRSNLSTFSGRKDKQNFLNANG